MPHITIPIPEDIWISMNMNLSEIAVSMCKEYAMKLYQEGKLTLVQAAKLCGMDWYDFMVWVSQAGTPIIDYTSEELEKEVAQFK